MKSKVKGFTLIELIVVMAIFSIVLAAATSMMQPVAKIMVYTDLNATGNAQVSNISQYLENSLGTAEYIRKANFVPTQEERINMVKYYVAENYSGILSKSTTIKDKTRGLVDLSGCKYGNGKVHLMVIDNEHNGKITEYIYNVSFEPKPTINDTVVTEATPASVGAIGCVINEFAVNKAYYDTFTYCIKPGTTADDSATFSFLNFLSGDSNKDTSFYITAETERNGKKYEFSTTSTILLANTKKSSSSSVSYNRTDKGRPKGVYYVAVKVADADGKNPTDAGYTETWGVVDQADAESIPDANVTPGCGARDPITDAGVAGTPSYGNKGTSSYPYDSAANGGGMCFIYSYGAEMITG